MHSLELQAEAMPEGDAGATGSIVEDDSLQCDGEPQYEAVPANLVQPAYSLTSDEKVSMSTALEAALEDFQAGAADLLSLRCLGLAYEAIDQGACDWFNENQHLADELLLVWSDFESAVSNLVSSMRPPSFPWQ